MSEITLNIPDEALSALRMTPEPFGAELRLAGAVVRRGVGAGRGSETRLPPETGGLRRGRLQPDGRGITAGNPPGLARAAGSRRLVRSPAASGPMRQQGSLR